MQGINGILHKKKIKILHFIFVSLSSSNCTIISSPTYLLINYFRITLPPPPEPGGSINPLGTSIERNAS